MNVDRAPTGLTEEQRARTATEKQRLAKAVDTMLAGSRKSIAVVPPNA